MGEALGEGLVAPPPLQLAGGPAPVPLAAPTAPGGEPAGKPAGKPAGGAAPRSEVGRGGGGGGGGLVCQACGASVDDDASPRGRDDWRGDAAASGLDEFAVAEAETEAAETDYDRLL